MSQFSCDVCPFESLGPFNATIWAIENPWFQQDSSLAGALGNQENQEASSSRPAHPLLGVFEGYRAYKFVSAPFNDVGGYPDHSAPEAASRGAQPQNPRTNSYNNNNNNNNNNGSSLPLGIHFCRVGDCRYWSTTFRQVSRHRNVHFGRRWLCPNQTGTCGSPGHRFARRDGVIEHCRRSRPCGESLANGGVIISLGDHVRERDLRPYEPGFHIPYERFRGGTR